MADLVAFTSGQAGRIGRVVRAAERSPAFLAGKPIPITRGDDSWIGQRTSIDDSAGGRYFGKTALKGIDVASADWTGGKSLPAGYELVAAEDVLLVNPAENGTAQHGLSVGEDDSWCQGRIIGRTDEDEPKAIVLMAGGAGGGDTYLPIKITGYSTITGATNRWRYNWIEQSDGQDGTWIDATEGATSAGAGYAYNSMEANNSASGVQGNGVDLATLPTGYSLQPIRGNPVVRGHRRTDCNGVAYITFEAANAVDGQCES